MAVLLAVTGCAPAGTGGTSSETLTVLAAASLTEPFTTLADTFERDHPGTTVRLAFDSSATLAEQVAQGAPADVLATADDRTMQRVLSSGLAADRPAVFATNRLVLVVPAANPADIERLADLDDPDVGFVACVDSAPCGALADDLLDEAGIEAEPVSEEVDVKAVLGKVVLDEADAGLVYVTDAVAAGDTVRQIEVSAAGRNVTSYPIVRLAGAADPGLAADWVELVLSDQGRRVLRADGFGAP
jgi:molybdate transport system substrate-binding protein